MCVRVTTTSRSGSVGSFFGPASKSCAHPPPRSCSTGLIFRSEKKAFIRAKYEGRRYAIVTCTSLEDRRQDLKQAVLSRDVFALLQVFAEGIDFMQPLPDMVRRVCVCLCLCLCVRFLCGKEVCCGSLLWFVVHALCSCLRV